MALHLIPTGPISLDSANENAAQARGLLGEAREASFLRIHAALEPDSFRKVEELAAQFLSLCGRKLPEAGNAAVDNSFTHGI